MLRRRLLKRGSGMFLRTAAPGSTCAVADARRRKNYVCRFNDIYERPTPEGGLYWRYSASIEEDDRVSGGWLGNYPSGLSGAVTDIALNKEWPKHDSD